MHIEIRDGANGTIEILVDGEMFLTIGDHPQFLGETVLRRADEDGDEEVGTYRTRQYALRQALDLIAVERC